MLKRYQKYVKDSTRNQEESESEDQDNFNQRDTLKLDAPEPTPEVKFKYCELCEKKLYNKRDYLKHKSSQKHLKKVKLVTYYKIMELGSINKFLIQKKMIPKLRNSRIGKVRYLLYSHLLRNMFNDLPNN